MKKVASTIRSGIANLFDSNKEFNEFLKVVLENGTAFTKHPFGLSVNKYPDLSDVVLVSDPRHTDSSVQALTTVLRCAISRHNNPTDPVPIRLRIIRGEYELDRSNPNEYTHWVWFEVSWRQGTFICGGCNDFSGGGGHGRRTLERTFNALTHLENISLEDVTIPMEKAERARQFIIEAHNEQSSESFAA